MYSNDFYREIPNNFNMYNSSYNLNGFNYNNLGNNGFKPNLFKRLTNGNNFNAFLNNTSKTLNVINQAIPIVNQAKPLINNIRTMFTIADIIKEDPQEEIKVSEIKKEEEKDNQPTFFL